MIAGFFATRVAYLLVAFDNVYWVEELYRGTVAHQLVHGRLLPLMDYQYAGYDGGSLIDSILAAAVFCVAGDSYLSLKLVGLLHHAGAIVIAFLIFYRYFGNRAAVLAAGILVLSPPASFRISTLTIGNYYECSFYILLTAYLAGLATESEGRRRMILWCMTGLVMGFGIYYSFFFIVALGPLAVAWLLTACRRVRLKELACLAIFSVIGLIPWFAYNAGHDWAGVRYLLHNRAPPQPLLLLAKVVRVIASVKDAWGAQLEGAAFFYALCGLGSSVILLLWLLPIVRKQLKLPPPRFATVVIALFPVFFFFSHSFFIADVPVDNASVYDDPFNYHKYSYKYLTAVLPFFSLTIVMAACLVSSASRSVARWICTAIVGLLCLTNIAGIAPELGSTRFAEGTRYAGYDYGFFAGMVLCQPLEDSVERFDRFGKPWKGRAFWAYGHAVCTAYRADPDRLITALQAGGRAHMPSMMKGVGESLARQEVLAGFDISHLESLVGERFPASEAQVAQGYGFGLGRHLGYPAFRTRKDEVKAMADRISQKAPYGLEEDVFIGFGMGLGAGIGDHDNAFQHIINSVPFEARNWVEQGWKMGLAYRRER
ncbi:ArnT family glycosyltransferase [Acidobacteriota bacterium]